MSVSEAWLREVLNQGDWLWLKKERSAAAAKEYAIRLVPPASGDGQRLVERRWGRAVDHRTGQLHQERHPAGAAVERAIKVARDKLARGYEVLGRSPDLIQLARDVDERPPPQPAEPAPSATGDAPVYAAIEAHSDTAVERVVAAFARAARAVDEAMPLADRVSDVVVGHSRHGQLYVIDGWCFGVAHEPGAYDWSNYCRVTERPCSGSALIEPGRAPVTALLFLLGAQREAAQAGVARFDIVDDAGLPVADTRRHPDTLQRLLALWGTDTEALRPALEQLGLVEERVDLAELAAAVADGWF